MSSREQQKTGITPYDDVNETTIDVLMAVANCCEADALQVLGDEAFVTCVLGKGRETMLNNSLRRTRALAAVVGVLLAGPVAAATITVTPATFDSAIAAAHGGDTLALVGTFGSLKIQNLDFASKVVLNAARATFTGTVVISNVDNLAIGGGTFNITGAPQFTQAVAVYGGSNISFNAVRMIGSAGGEGITFNGTNAAVVTSGTFTGLQVGVVFGSVTNGNATRNTITGAVSDGIDIANSHGVSATYNTCSAGNPGPGVHPDCIQLWSVTGQPLQSQIIVRNNSATGPTQGFTAFASMGGEQQVQIVQNSVDTSFPQGVACYECVNSVISYNTLATMTGAAHLTNLTISGGTGNVVVGNIIKPYVAPRPDGAQLTFALDASDAAIETPPDLNALVGGPPPLLTESPAAVPEPSGWALLVAGFAAVGVARRRAGRPAAA